MSEKRKLVLLRVLTQCRVLHVEFEKYIFHFFLILQFSIFVSKNFTDGANYYVIVMALDRHLIKKYISEGQN
jgi:hypothetical protein